MGQFNQRCNHCGQSTSSNALGRYCTRCGSPLAAPAQLGSASAGRSVGAAYGLWALCLVGVAGVPRFYAGKYVTGVIWLFTWGLLGIGSLIDLLLIPGMIEEANLRNSVRTAW